MAWDIAITEEVRRLQDRLASLEAALVRPVPVVARYTTGAGQAVAHNTLTIINYGSLTYDTQSLVTTGVNWRFTAKQDGYYAVAVAVLLDGTTAWAPGEFGELRVYRNGGVFSWLDRKDNFDAAASQYMQLSGADVVQLNAGDYLDVRVVHVAGVSLSLYPSTGYNYVAIQKV